MVPEVNHRARSVLQQRLVRAGDRVRARLRTDDFSGHRLRRRHALGQLPLDQRALIGLQAKFAEAPVAKIPGVARLGRAICCQRNFISTDFANLQPLTLERRRAPMRRGLSFSEVPPGPFERVRYALNSGIKADIARGRRWANSGSQSHLRKRTSRRSNATNS